MEKNHVHDLGTGVLGTHGALYCLGFSPGTVLRNNYTHHVHAAEAWGAGEGIILDNGSVGILVENNELHDAVAGGWGCNFNLYWQSRGEPVRFMRHTFDEWKAKRLDVHSVIADPLFVDPGMNDFRLRPESRAFQLGFRPIELQGVGPRARPQR